MTLWYRFAYSKWRSVEGTEERPRAAVRRKEMLSDVEGGGFPHERGGRGVSRRMSNHAVEQLTNPKG